MKRAGNFQGADDGDGKTIITKRSKGTYENIEVTVCFMDHNALSMIQL